MATTAILLSMGLTVVEVTLLYFGIVLLDTGPIGIIVDIAFIVPAEFLMLDIEVGVDKSIYDTITSGTREGNESKFIFIPILKRLVRKLED